LRQNLRQDGLPGRPDGLGAVVGSFRPRSTVRIRKNPDASQIRAGGSLTTSFTRPASSFAPVRYAPWVALLPGRLYVVNRGCGPGPWGGRGLWQLLAVPSVDFSV